MYRVKNMNKILKKVSSFLCHQSWSSQKAINFKLIISNLPQQLIKKKGSLFHQSSCNARVRERTRLQGSTFLQEVVSTAWTPTTLLITPRCPSSKKDPYILEASNSLKLLSLSFQRPNLLDKTTKNLYPKPHIRSWFNTFNSTITIYKQSIVIFWEDETVTAKNRKRGLTFQPTEAEYSSLPITYRIQVAAETMTQWGLLLLLLVLAAVVCLSVLSTGVEF